jgi:hypothetical protein
MNSDTPLATTAPIAPYRLAYAINRVASHQCECPELLDDELYEEHHIRIWPLRHNIPVPISNYALSTASLQASVSDNNMRYWTC